MRFTSVALAILMASFSVSSPLPGDDEPISDAQLARIKELGLDKRGPVLKRGDDEPISDAQLAKIKELGLDRRSDGGSIEARDKRSSCGETLEGEHAGGHGVWCPLDQYYDRVNSFCGAKAGTDIHKNHESSDTYGITLTNQDNPDAIGSDGNLVFAIKNLHDDGTYLVKKDECMTYMNKQVDEKSRCWGQKNNDTEGGYWSIDKVGLFGFEVHTGKVG